MHTKRFLLAALVASLGAATARAEQVDAQTVAVPVNVRILPFAEVVLDTSTINIHLEAGETYAEGSLSGTIRTNVGAQVRTRLAKPAGVPVGEDWQIAPESTTVNGAGEFAFPRLVQISVYAAVGSVFDGSDHTIQVYGHSADHVSQAAPPPTAGSATITVIPHGS